MIIDKIIGNYYHPTYREIIATIILVIFAICYARRRNDWNKLQKTVCPLLIFFLCLVMGITIFNRLPFDEVKYSFNLFWSYRLAAQGHTIIWEIILNYFLIFPFGLVAPLYIRKRYVILCGFLLSLGIEITQFIMKRGMFEFDDIVGNTLGVVLGIGLYSIFESVRTKAIHRHPH